MSFDGQVAVNVAGIGYPVLENRCLKNFSLISTGMDIPYDILKSQYESLKVEYDEFCESSREIEMELEKSLKEAEAKNTDLMKKCKLAEDRLQQHQLKSTQLTSDNVKVGGIWHSSLICPVSLYHNSCRQNLTNSRSRMPNYKRILKDLKLLLMI